MDSKISIVFISLYLLKCVSGTAYYEITSATGETSIQPFFSLSPEAGIVAPAITGGGIGLVLGAVLIGCCNLFGTKSVTALKSQAEEEDETEVKPAKSVVPADNSTNSTKTAKTKRSINNYQARIISAAETPGKWY